MAKYVFAAKFTPHTAVVDFTTRKFPQFAGAHTGVRAHLNQFALL